MEFSDDGLPERALTLPPAKYVLLAGNWLNEADGDEPLFHFVRALKAHAKLKGLDAEAAYRMVVGAFRAAGVEPALAHLHLEDEDAMVGFYRLWGEVRFPMGADPVEVACRLAGDGLLRGPAEWPGRFPRFLTVAALLQVQRPQAPILLPVRKVGAEFGCEPNTVSAWIGFAKLDRLLVLTKRHAFRSGSESRAAEYVFALHRWGPDVHVQLGSLVGITVREEDIDWIKRHFEPRRVRAS